MAVGMQYLRFFCIHKIYEIFETFMGYFEVFEISQIYGSYEIFSRFMEFILRYFEICMRFFLKVIYPRLDTAGWYLP